MQGEILYQLANLILMMGVVFLFKLLYDRLEVQANRTLLLATAGLALDMVGWYAISYIDSVESAMICYRITIFGRILFGVGFIIYIKRTFKAVFSDVVLIVWLVSILGTLAHTFFPGDNYFLTDLQIVTIGGINTLVGIRGPVYWSHLFGVFIVGLWGSVVLLKRIRTQRDKENTREYINAIFYFLAVLIQGIAVAFREINFTTTINFIPITRAFATGVYAFLSLKYNILNYEHLAGKALMNDIGAGFAVLSDKFEVLYVNNITSVLFPNVKEEQKAPDEFIAIVQNNEYQFSKNGHVYKATADRVIQNEKLEGYTILIVEITDIVNLENQALENEISRNNLLTNISHEIRTPLNAIAGASDMMKAGNLSEADYKQYVEVIRSSTISLNDILNDLLTASGENKTDSEAGSPYSVITLMDNVIDMCNDRVAKKQVMIQVSLDEDLPVNAIGEDGKIRQILLNVLTNAIRYTSDGIVSIRLSGEFLSDGRFEYCYSITDTGRNVFKPGIDTADAKSDDNLGVDFSTGYGISVMVARRLAGALDGQFSVNSIPDKGNVYTIRIPSLLCDKKTISSFEFGKKMSIAYCGEEDPMLDSLERACSRLSVNFDVFAGLGRVRKLTGKENLCNVLLFNFERYGKRMLSQERTAGYVKVAVLTSDDIPDGFANDVIFVREPLSVITLYKILMEYEERKNKEYDAALSFSAPLARVLVVDDNDINLEIARTIIERFKISVDTVENGYECLDLINSGKKYDIIFMDYMMEGMDGIETTEKIRALDSPMSKVKILAFTANAVDGAEEKYLAGGMDGCVFKPANTEAFAKAIWKFLPRELIVFENTVEEKKPEESFEDFPEIEGVDREAAIKYCGGNINMYRDMLGTFSNESEEKIATILDDFEREDYKNFTILVHGIKGLSRTLGINRLSEMMAEMEKAGSREDSEYIKANISELLSYYRRCGKLLAQFGQTKQAKSVEVNGDKVGEILLKMRDFLDDFEMAETEKLFKEIWPGEYDEAKRPLMGLLGESIERVDYYASIEYVDRLLDTYKVTEEN